MGKIPTKKLIIITCQDAVNSKLKKNFLKKNITRILIIPVKQSHLTIFTDTSKNNTYTAAKK